MNFLDFRNYKSFNKIYKLAEVTEDFGNHVYSQKEDFFLVTRKIPSYLFDTKIFSHDLFISILCLRFFWIFLRNLTLTRRSKKGSPLVWCRDPFWFLVNVYVFTFDQNSNFDWFQTQYRPKNMINIRPKTSEMKWIIF